MSNPAKVKTVDEVRAEFAAAGITVSEWARANGFSRMTVVDLLRGQRQGKSGAAHRCAVALGLKAGVVVEDIATFKPAGKTVSYQVKPAKAPTPRKARAGKKPGAAK